jgi:protein SCO1/2
VKTRGKILLVLGLAVLALALAARFLPSAASRAKGGDFALQGAHGPLTLAALRGQVVLLYFGYTHCPDVCPVSMAAGAQALNRLSPAERAKVKLLFVSVDPERDTPARLQEYTAYFHPDMLGATGTPEEIARMARAYGAGYVKRAPGPDGNYAVDHSAQTFVIAPDGRLVEEIPFGAKADDIIAVVRRWMK